MNRLILPYYFYINIIYHSEKWMRSMTTHIMCAAIQHTNECHTQHTHEACSYMSKYALWQLTDFRQPLFDLFRQRRTICENGRLPKIQIYYENSLSSVNFSHFKCKLNSNSNRIYQTFNEFSHFTEFFVDSHLATDDFECFDIIIRWDHT